MGLDNEDIERKHGAGWFQRLRNDVTYRYMLYRTVWICLSFIMLGWVEAMFGPTFPDLRQIIQEDLDTASWLFTATSVGFFTGSIITGLVYEKFQRDLMLVVSILGTAIAITAVPWCPYFYLMLPVRTVAGIMGASLDTAGNAQVVSMWKNNAGPYMQAIHFSFSLGGMISPLVAQPFLSSEACRDLERTNNESITPVNTSLIHEVINGSVVRNGTSCLYEGTRIHIAYLISGVMIAITSLPFLAAMLTTQTSHAQGDKPEADNADKTGFNQLPLHLKMLILILLSSLMALYCGTEDTFAGFLMSFLISQLNWTKSNGAFATSVYWICFGLSRLVGIFIDRFAKTTTLISTYSILLSVSLTGLLVSTIFRINILVWIFVGAVGCSLSIIFASMFTWTTESITQVAGKISAMFMASASFGVILFPLLFGYTMKWLSPMWFLYLLLGQSILWVILFTITRLLAKHFLSAAKVELFIPENQPLNSK